MGGSASRDGGFKAGDRVWVTGASSGLGEALALKFAEKGASLVLSARRADVLQDVAKRCTLRGAKAVSVVSLDQATVGTPDFGEKVAEALAAYGGFEAVVLNGGVGTRGSALDTEVDVLKRVLDVNFVSHAEIARLSARKMKEDGVKGRIVVISSVQGFFGQPQRSAYAASKHALHGYFDALRAELAAQGTSVTVASPGYIKTAHSLNALKGDGVASGQLDASTEKGACPTAMAGEIFDAAERRQSELSPSAGLSAQFARLLRASAPGLLFAIMEGKAAKAALESN
ncbi:putative 3-oxoacyl-reductase [Pelagophyceae sp. CCMP2097]|nr:putative 3-oxoacyl-reductase [Pelagophyceae sp. CCMP2097]